MQVFDYLILQQKYVYMCSYKKWKLCHIEGTSCIKVVLENKDLKYNNYICLLSSIFFIVDDIICSANKLPYIQWPGATINPSQRHFNVSFWFWVITPYKRTEKWTNLYFKKATVTYPLHSWFFVKKIELFLPKIRHLERKKCVVSIIS